MSQIQYLVHWGHTHKTKDQTDVDSLAKSLCSFGLLVFGLVAVTHVEHSVLRVDHVANPILGTFGTHPQDQTPNRRGYFCNGTFAVLVMVFGLVAVTHVANSVFRLGGVATSLRCALRTHPHNQTQN